jgi:serine/threonine-protein kinase
VLFRSKIDDQTGREAIEKELDHVRHFAQIDHPNLVTIEDMGVVLGVPYLIMGYAGEDTLARRLKREHLGVERALGYFTQVARGVLALHDRRLVHFDLKPSNVFLKGEIARVGDYGLAKLLTEGRSTLSFGRGTPHYMAPEMLKNRADHRADIYSLGVILYECLTGALPFDEEPGGGFVVREHDDPPKFPPEFPIALRGVVERALRLDPDARHASVEELLAELGQTGRQGESIVVPREFASAESIPGRAPGAAERAERTPTPTQELSPAPGAPTPSIAAAQAADSAPGTRAAAPARSADDARTPGVARQASRELARGAAEVALGVWEGLRSVRAQSPSASAASPGARSGDPQSAAPSAEASASAAAGGGSVALAGAAVAAAPAGTVPVPPRVEGGVLRTVATSLALGLEVLVSLILAPVRRALFGVGRASTGFVKKGHGVFGVLWRLALLAFVLVVAGLGLAMAAYLVYLLLIG